MDERLAELLNTVLQTPAGSLERRDAMSRLLSCLERLPGLYKSTHPLYSEALNKTWLWVTRNIEDFDPRRSNLQATNLTSAFTNWINGYLRHRVQDLRQLPNDLSIDAPIGNGGDDRTFSENLESPSLSGLDAYIAREQERKHQRRTSRFIQWIREDPEQKLRNIHPRKHPDCHVQAVAIQHYLDEPPKTIAEIARNFNVNYSALNSFLKRTVIPLLRQIAEDFGFSPEDIP